MTKDPEKIKAQRARAVANVAAFRRRRKKELVERHGGRCQRCGYDKCLSALVFHHRDPSTKLFNISVDKMQKKLALVEAEADKCDLLCANCHAEVHYEEEGDVLET